MQTYEEWLAEMTGGLRVSTSGTYSMNSPYIEAEFLLMNEFKPIADSGGMGGRVGAALHPEFYKGSWMDKKSWVAEVMMLVFVMWPQGVPKMKALAGISIMPNEFRRSRKVSLAVFMVKNLIVDISEMPKAGQTTIAALRFMWPRVSFLANKITKKMLIDNGYHNEWIYSREREMFAPCCLAGVDVAQTGCFLNNWAMDTSNPGLKSMIWDSRYMQQLFKFADQQYLSDEKKFMTKEMKAASPVESFDVSDMKFFAFLEIEVSIENISVLDSGFLQSTETVFATEDTETSVVMYNPKESLLTSRWAEVSSPRSSREQILIEIREALEEAGFPDDAMTKFI